MTGILTGKRGLAGLVLVLVVTWALGAVMLLTGTLVAAQQINRDVKSIINPNLNKIYTNTHEIALARTTRSLTARIEAAATPLTGQLAATLIAANAIDATGTPIEAHAASIDTKVASIANRASAVDSSIAQIQHHVDSIGSSVAGIGASVGSIGAHVQSILADVNAIHSRVVSVLGDARGIESTGRQQILPAVRLINAHATAVLDSVRTIDANLSAVLGDVGTIQAGGVDAHANAIDCSKLLNTRLLGAPTTGCGR